MAAAAAFLPLDRLAGVEAGAGADVELDGKQAVRRARNCQEQNIKPRRKTCQQGGRDRRLEESKDVLKDSRCPGRRVRVAWLRPRIPVRQESQIRID